MRVDWYIKGVLTVIAVSLSLIALSPWFSSQRLEQMINPQPAEAQEAIKLSAPKVWGKVVGYSPGSFLFEATDGTLRQWEPGRGGLQRLVERN